MANTITIRELKQIVAEELATVREGSMMESYTFNVNGQYTVTSADGPRDKHDAQKIAEKYLKNHLDNLQLKLAHIYEDLIPGGLSDKLSIEDIAKKHGVPVEHIVAQIKKGAKVEREHTDDVRKAVEISMDHLTEDPSYYDKLDKMEHPNG